MLMDSNESDFLDASARIEGILCFSLLVLVMGLMFRSIVYLTTWLSRQSRISLTFLSREDLALLFMKVSLGKYKLVFMKNINSLIVFSLFLIFSASSFGDDACSREKVEICRQADFLAQKLRDVSGEASVVKVESINGTIIYGEKLDVSLSLLSEESSSVFMSQIQKVFCSVPYIADFVKRGGEFLYRVESNLPEDGSRTLVLHCI